MGSIVAVTLKGILRDRVFHGIIGLACLLLLIPSAASFSMRQVTDLSITLSLSLICFILLLLSVFLGATSIWKDLERRYSYSVLSLPISRASYILGRFLGLALFLIMTSSVLGVCTMLVVKITSQLYPPDRPVVWGYLVLAIVFATLKYILLVAVALLLSTVSTSFFLPIFGAVCTFLASSITQQVYEYVHSPAAGNAVTPFMKEAATVAYYLLPNFAAFDLKVNAIYSIAPNLSGLWLTGGYFLAYTTVLLGAATLLFTRREMK